MAGHLGVVLGATRFIGMIIHGIAKHQPLYTAESIARWYGRRQAIEDVALIEVGI